MATEFFAEIDPPQRLLMGPGPVNAHPRVLRAMSADLLGQFDPEMTAYMNEVMALYRPIFGTRNPWTFLVDGTARAGIEAALVSLVAPNDTVLVVNFGRFGLLLTEILGRIGAKIENCLAQDYPGKLRIVVASDGSDDATDDIVRGYQYEKGKYVVVSDEELDSVFNF